jgi:hypothetical protein
LHTVDLVSRGQIDGYLVLAVGVAGYALKHKHAWLMGLALVAITAKPTNVLLALGVLAWGMRGWAWRKWLKVLALPVVALVWAVWACGVDWPLRFMSWSALPGAQQFCIAIWRWTPTLATYLWAGLILGSLARGTLETEPVKVLPLAMVLNLVISPYVTGYHCVAVAPLLVWVAQRSPRAALVCWVLTWTPLLRLVWGWSVAPVDLLYPVAVLACWTGVQIVGLCRTRSLMPLRREAC